MIFMTCLMLCTAPSQAAFVKVYILTGQSNSLGTTADPDETDYTPGTDPADVETRFFWNNVLDATTSLGDSGGLITTLQQQQGANEHPTFWGPEFGFARKMYAEGEDNVMVIKASRAGGGNTHWSKANGGHMYQEVVSTVNAATSQLVSTGDTYEIAGLLYLQGESDDSYEASVSGSRLSTFIDNLRADLPHATNMKTVIGGIAAASSTRDVVRAQQTMLAAGSSDIEYFSNLDLQGGLYDNLHFDKPSKLIVGERYANAFLSGTPDPPQRPGHIEGGPVMPGGTTPYAWYRADQDIVTHDSSSQVAFWGDQSGNDRHLAAAGDPQLSNNGVDDLQTVTFDGNGDYLDSYAAEWGESGPGTVFAICKRTGNGDGISMLYDSAADEQRQGFAIRTDEGDPVVVCGGTVYDGGFDNNWVTDLEDPVGTDNWAITSVSHTTGSTDTIRVNGEAVYTGDLLSGGMTGLRIGGYVLTYGHTWEGEIAELIVFEGQLSDIERAAVERQLMHRWGIGPAPLPGDANYDGTVNEADAAILASNWLTEEDAAWTMGDFNGDGNVNDLDATLLASNWQVGASDQASLPEPGTLVLLLVGMSVLLVSRKRSHPCFTAFPEAADAWKVSTSRRRARRSCRALEQRLRLQRSTASWRPES